MSTKLFTFLVLSFASAAFSEDFKTVNGKEYKDATVTRVEPDGIVVKTNSGVTKIYFAELPKDVQERFHYDSEKAASYSAEQAANYAAYQKQQEETRRQQADADAKNNAVRLNNRPPQIARRPCRPATPSFRSRRMICFVQIGQAKQPGPAYREGKSVRHHPNPLASQLPRLQSHLSDVRSEKTAGARGNWRKRSDSNQKAARNARAWRDVFRFCGNGRDAIGDALAVL